METTPRPDETPFRRAGPRAAGPGRHPATAAAPVPPAANAADPAFGQFYGQAYATPPQPAQQPAQQSYGAPPGEQVVPSPLSPTDERTWGMAAHGIALAVTVFSAGFLSFVAALVTYLVVRDRGPFVRHHAANALNVQIIAGIVMLVSAPADVRPRRVR